MSLISEQIKEIRWLKDMIIAHISSKNLMKNVNDILGRAIDTIETLSAKVYANNMHGGWIPVEERLPENDDYILLSFENFPLPMIGRYEENEAGGAFYLGDCNEEDTCSANDLFVNAWMELPEAYRPENVEE